MLSLGKAGCSKSVALRHVVQGDVKPGEKYASGQNSSHLHLAMCPLISTN